ncbi:MAG: DUF1697 domain-containing protein [Acidobacteriota bacterium]
MHIALLRGINVGGNKMIAMADLRDLLTNLGFAGARSLLQSGNLVFHGDRRTPAQLETLLAAETEKRLGVQADVFVRTASELAEVVARNPFAEEAKRDPSHLLVMFLKDVPDATAVAALNAAIIGREAVRVIGRHAYIAYPDGIGTSKLTGAVIEKKLGTRGTARNWNTVMKLSRLAGEE